MTVFYLTTGATTHDSGTVALGVDSGTTIRAALSTSPSMTSPTFQSVTRDADGYAKATFTGLAVDTSHYCAVEVDGVLDAKVARFRTHPAAPGQVGSSKLGTSGCSPGSAQPASDHPVFDTIRTDNPLFFLHSGDLHYKNLSTTNAALYQAANLDSMQANRARQMYESCALVYMYDDHDFGPNDSYGTGGAGSVGRAAVTGVYRQMFPHYPLVNPSSGSLEHVFDVCRVRFIVTDQRYHRTNPAGADGPSKTVLGATQKQWFKDQVLAAKNDPDVMLTVWVSTQVPPLGVAGDANNWYNFDHERRELWDFFADNEIRDLIIVSGDIHATGFQRAADLSTSQTAPIRIYTCGPLENTTLAERGEVAWDAIVGAEGQHGTLEFDDQGEYMTVTFKGYRTEADGSAVWLNMTDTFTIGHPPLAPGLYLPRDEDGDLRWIRDEDGERRYIVVT